jgi:salicylate hydroxylase
LSAALSTKLANPAHRVTILETVRELQEVGVSQENCPRPMAKLLMLLRSLPFPSLHQVTTTPCLTSPHLTYLDTNTIPSLDQP